MTQAESPERIGKPIQPDLDNASEGKICRLKHYY